MEIPQSGEDPETNPTMQGYDELRDGAAWLEMSGRGKIRVAGEDRARFLHAMTTNHIQQLTPGKGCYAFFLTAQGRILADVNVLCRPDDVTLEDLTPTLTTIAVEGPRFPDVLSAATAPALEAGYGDNVEWGSGLLASLSVTGSPGVFIILPTAEKAEILRRIGRAGAVPADEEAFRVVRLEHGKPRDGEDISERYLALEADQTAALHFHKGCYLGQEIVERVRSRGLLQRVLRAVEIDGRTPPEPRTKLQIDGTSVGEITSAAYSPALGKVVALAYLRVAQAETGTEMIVGETRARVR